MKNIFKTQQEKLEFSGWGGKDQKKVLARLNKQEIANIASIANTSFYTRKEIIKSIWEVLVNWNWQGGLCLEPSVGSGRFLYYQPKMYKNSWIGLDPDEVAIGIARELNPQANLYVSRFEDVYFTEQFFDLVMSNIPFGGHTIKDEVTNSSFKIHNYFLLRSARLLKQNGLLVAIAPTGFMDSPSADVRRKMQEMGMCLLYAFRFPNVAEGTDVTSDLLFFMKTNKKGSDYLESATMSCLGLRYDKKHELRLLYPEQTCEQLVMNEYFWKRPEYIFGEIVPHTAYEESYSRISLKLREEESVESFCREIVALAQPVFTDVEFSQTARKPNLIPMDKWHGQSVGSVIELEDKYYLSEGLVLKSISNSQAHNLSLLKKLLASFDNLIQANGESQAKLTEAQAQIKADYLQFLEQIGYLNDPKNIAQFKACWEYRRLLSLEMPSPKPKYDFPSLKGATKHYQESPLFSERVLENNLPQSGTIKDSHEALCLSLNVKGELDLSYIAELMGISVDDVPQRLGSLLIFDPVTQTYCDRSSYLSGDIYQKLSQVRELDEELLCQELGKILPPIVLPPSDCPFIEEIKKEMREYLNLEVQFLDNAQIEIINLAWIPVTLIEEFLFYVTKRKILVKQVGEGSYSLYPVTHTPTPWEKAFSTDRVTFLKLFEDLLRQKRTEVWSRVDDKILDAEATELANTKKQEIFSAFLRWAWHDSLERAAQLTYYYNSVYNTFVSPKFDGSNLRFLAGINKTISLRPYQKDGIWRIMRSPSTLLAWDVGIGKSFTLISATQELRRLNLVRRPMIVIPNAIVSQFCQDYITLYPSARILEINADNLDDRHLLLNAINSSNWDAIIVAMSVFDNNITVSPEVMRQQLEDVASSWGSETKGLRPADLKKYSSAYNRYKKAIDKMVEAKSKKKERVIYFDDLNIDMLVIDEAHEYKNLTFFTENDSEGLNNIGSAKALSCLFKVHWLLNKYSNGKVVFSTATPIANSVAELWTFLRYLMPNVLKEKRSNIFDRWLSVFGESVTKPEIHPTKGYVTKTRIRRFTNRQELLKMAHLAFDVLKTQDLVDRGMLKVPTPTVINEVSPLSPLQQEYLKWLVVRSKAIESKVVTSDVDNPLVVLQNGREAVLDERLVCDGDNFLDNKLNTTIYNVFRIWRDTAHLKATQLIFSDESTPKPNSKLFTAYQYIKLALVALGVPEEEIAFIHDYDSKSPQKRAQLKLALSRQVNEGKIRIVLGSTRKLGTGVNVQKRLIAVHHLSIGYRSIDIEQRNGRILRQGNLFSKVLIFYYVTKGISASSLDSFLWQIIRTKQEFCNNALIDNGERSIYQPEIDDSQEQLPTATLMAIALGNPVLKRISDLRQKLDGLVLEKRSYDSEIVKHDQKVKDHNKLVSRLEPLLDRFSSGLDILKSYTNDSTISLSSNNIEFSWGMDDKQKAKIRKRLLKWMLSQADKQLPLCSFGDLSISVVLTEHDKGGNYYIRFCVDDADEYISPSKFMNLETLVSIMQNHYDDFSTKYQDTLSYLKILSNRETVDFPHDKLQLIDSYQSELEGLLASLSDEDLEFQEGNGLTIEPIALDNFRNFKSNKGFCMLEDLTPEQLDIMQSRISSSPSWVSSLEDVISSWSGNDQAAIEEADAIQAHEESLFDWSEELSAFRPADANSQSWRDTPFFSSPQPSSPPDDFPLALIF